MSEVDRARRARERGDGRTWRERALAAEADREADRRAAERLLAELDGLRESLDGFEKRLAALIHGLTYGRPEWPRRHV